jgi:hypothetical protein
MQHPAHTGHEYQKKQKLFHVQVSIQTAIRNLYHSEFARGRRFCGTRTFNGSARNPVAVEWSPDRKFRGAGPSSLDRQRHLWEVVEVNGKTTAGLMKDTVVAPYFRRAVVDFTADQPGLSMFHCHIQQHMDYGFKALFRYA